MDLFFFSFFSLIDYYKILSTVLGPYWFYILYKAVTSLFNPPTPSRLSSLSKADPSYVNKKLEVATTQPYCKGG